MIGNLRICYDSATAHIFEGVPLYVHYVDHVRTTQKIVVMALHMQDELPPPLLLSVCCCFCLETLFGLILLSIVCHTLAINQIQTRLFTFMTPIRCCYLLD